MEFGVLGGDLRQLRLAEWLAARGRSVAAWGLERENSPLHVPLTEAVEAENVILPLPVSRDGEGLTLPLSGESLALERLWEKLKPEQRIFGGAVTEEAAAGAAEHGLKVEDYFCREELLVRNAAVTAEGAIQRALEATEGSLLGAPCLVVGFGRIGRLLARRLQGLGARVWASARKPADLAWIQALGYCPMTTGDWAGQLGQFRFLFNTVPARIIGPAALAELEDCLVIDLASDPGGVDRAAAERLGVALDWARFLPGRLAPTAAAEAMGRTILELVKEREDG